MHEEAYRYIESKAGDVAGLRVLEIGSYDVNGSPRPIFAACAEYVGIDERAGPDVDIVASARDYQGGEAFDVVVCAEVLEHAANPMEVLACAWRALRWNGGRLILTAASVGRKPHGCNGGAVGPGKHYANVDTRALQIMLGAIGFTGVRIEYYPQRGDVYAVAEKILKRR